MNTSPPPSLSFPTTFSFPDGFPLTLAFGSHLKNTVCALKGNLMRISDVHPNLESENDFRSFRKSVDEMKDWLGRPPEVLACDLHPDYVSTRMAARMTEENPETVLTAVQHHHAHIVSCMAECDLQGPVLGVALDGTGYGVDETIWGGEVLLAGRASFRRMGYLQPIPLPGGTRAVAEPWRTGLSYLLYAFDNDIDHVDIDIVRRRRREDRDLVQRMIARGINAPLSSSCGRLFDAVAAILSIRTSVCHEGEAAMELERLAGPEWEYSRPGYSLSLNRRDGVVIMDPAAMVRDLVHESRKGESLQTCSRKFHASVIHAFANTVIVASGETGVRTVVLSGGCFLNSHLRVGLERELSSRGLSVFLPRRLHVGDASLSLGQAVVAASLFRGNGSEHRSAERAMDAALYR
jgi:hydrogenase maturation protein HypF